MSGTLEISLLGGVSLKRNGQAVTEVTSRKATALFIYLACRLQPASRDRLAGLFYGDCSQKRAVANVRVLLTRLGPLREYLHITRREVAFNPATDYQVDSQCFEAGLAAVNEQQAAAQDETIDRIESRQGIPMPVGIPMPADNGIGMPLLQHDHYQPGLKQVTRLLELDPLHEAGHRQMMTLLALNGQRNEALAHYETCRQALRQEIDVDPAEETTRLYERIRAGELSRSGAEPGSEEKILARVPRPSRSPRPAALAPFLTAAPLQRYAPTAFVARDRALTQLAGFLEKTVAGQGQVVFVTGEAGSGKTTLVQEFARRVQKRHPELIVATGNGHTQTGVGDPYLPFREILSLLSGDVEDRRAANAMTLDSARRLWRLMPETVQALLESGPNLVDTFVAGPALEARATTAMANDAAWLAYLSASLDTSGAVNS